MKVSYIVGIVLPAHVVGLWILLFQPGCQSSQRTAPDPAITQIEVPDPRPVSKPVSAPVADTPNQGVDSAFNAGLDAYDSAPQPTPGVKAEPMRPMDAGSDFSSTDIGSGDLDIPGWDTDSSEPDEFYKVVKGDTLSQIAKRNNISLASLLKANDLQRNSVIHIGQELLIPGGAPVEIDVTAASSSSTKYKVKRGDTLSVIAKKHGVTLSALKSVNNLNTDIIYVGQELNLPNSAKVQRIESAPIAKKGDRYTVRSGDSLGKIANRYGVKVSQLKAVNALSRDTIYVGQKLYLPDSAKKLASKPKSTSRPPVQSKPQPAPRAQPVDLIPEPAPVPTVEVVPVIMTVEDTVPEATSSDETLDALKMLSPESDFDAPVLPVEAEQAIPAN